MPGLRFEKLTREHDRARFDCGAKDLNTYIQQFARQNARNKLGETYVLTDASKEIFGFYTNSTASLEYDAYPDKKGLPKYAIPSALIARLAVDKHQQGKGYGKLLLIDALKKILKISDEIGIHCITVEAKDEAAKQFYQRYGFEALSNEQHHLFISVKKVKNSFS